MVRLFTKKIVCLAIALMICSCGEVGYQETEQDALTLVDLYPHYGEVDVPSDVTVVAVFSDEIVVGDQGGNINSGVFYIEDDLGNVISNTVVSRSDRDNTGSTILITLTDNQRLSSNEKYWIVLDGSIQGSSTESIGVEIRSYFFVE
jgi:hypothetical protein